MLSITDARGVIFDVDETLLDNLEDNPLTGLHNLARLHATQEVGRRHNLPQLVNLTPEQSSEAFHNASVHSLEGATWQILYSVGVVTTKEIEPRNPLVLEILAGKHVEYERLLRTKAKPYPGAVDFVHWVAASGLEGHMAIASTALRRDIHIFLEMTGLTRYFPDTHIISLGEIIHPKPDPEAFDKAFLSLGLPESARNKVIAFEDNPRGIMSAKSAGLYTCAITNAHPKEKLESLATAPDLVADSFDEFRSLLSAKTT